jgi:hypothetical protein
VIESLYPIIESTQKSGQVLLHKTVIEYHSQEWVFSEKYFFEHKTSGDVISKVFKYHFVIREISLEQLKLLPGYKELDESEQEELYEQYLLLEKKPRKIIIYR